MGANVAIPSKQESRFIGAVGKDEVEALKNGDADLLRVIVQSKTSTHPAKTTSVKPLKASWVPIKWASISRRA